MNSGVTIFRQLSKSGIESQNWGISIEQIVLRCMCLGLGFKQNILLYSRISDITQMTALNLACLKPSKNQQMHQIQNL